MSRTGRRSLLVRRVAAASLAALLALAPACGDDSVLVCDVREASCHQDMFRTVGRILGRPTLDTVPVDLVTPEEWVAERIRWLWPTGDVYDFVQAEAFFQIGFLRERTDSSDRAAIDALGGRVAASYGGTPRRISVIVPDGAASIDHEEASRSLAHEVVHAYQDDAFRALELFDTLLTAGDDPEAELLRAAIEGQALVATALLDARRLGLPPDQLDWQRWVDATVRDVLEAVDASTSPFLEVRPAMSYAAGAAMTIDALVSADYDIRATDDLIRRPPTDMASLLGFLLHPQVPLERRTTPLELPLSPRPPAPLLTPEVLERTGLSYCETWSFDAWDVALLIAPEAGAREAVELATECGGATLEVFITEDGATVSVFHSRWRWPDVAQDAVSILARMHRTAEWKGESPASAPEFVELRRGDRDVVLVVSPDEALSQSLVDAVFRALWEQSDGSS